MAHPLAPHLSSFCLNDVLYKGALAAIPEAEADRRLDARTNTPRSIAVHLLGARHGLLGLMGARIDPLPWSDLGEGFEMGFAMKTSKPRLADVLAIWNKLSEHLDHHLLSASDRTLAQPSPIPIPGKPDGTLADFAVLNVVHESYHLGQLGLYAKALTGRGIMTPKTEDATA